MINNVLTAKFVCNAFISKSELISVNFSLLKKLATTSKLLVVLFEHVTKDKVVKTMVVLRISTVVPC